jgi:hypothetical protein
LFIFERCRFCFSQATARHIPSRVSLGDRCDLPPAGVLATIDGERLASDELGSLKIKNRVDNLAYLAHATDRDAGRQRIHGFQGRASAF